MVRSFRNLCLGFEQAVRKAVEGYYITFQRSSRCSSFNQNLANIITPKWNGELRTSSNRHLHVPHLYAWSHCVYATKRSIMSTQIPPTINTLVSTSGLGNTSMG